MTTPNSSYVSHQITPINSQNQPAPPRQILNPPKLGVIFFNTTNTTINIRWWATEQRYNDYGDIAPKRYVYLQTYYGHRWAFYDTVDGEVLTTNYNSPDDEDIYYSAKRPSSLKDEDESPRQSVLIKRRVQSLAYSALKVVAQRPDLKELQLPTKVKDALIAYFERKEAFVAQHQEDVHARRPRQVHPLVMVPRFR